MNRHECRDALACVSNALRGQQRRLKRLLNPQHVLAHCERMRKNARKILADADAIERELKADVSTIPEVQLSVALLELERQSFARLLRSKEYKEVSVGSVKAACRSQLQVWLRQQTVNHS